MPINSEMFLITGCEHFETLLNISALDDLIKSKMLRHQDGAYGCSECEYSTKYYTTILNHIGTTLSAIGSDSKSILKN